MKLYKKPDLHGRLDKHKKLVKKGKQVVLYEIYDGFGIPVEVLKAVKSIEIHYKGVVYNAGVDDFRRHGIEHYFGEERQYVLPRKFWKVANQEALL